MKNFATIVTAAVALTAASAVSAGQINRSTNALAFRHANIQSHADQGYALTGEQTVVKAASSKARVRTSAYLVGGRNSPR